jgi:hypothetical protein
VHLSIWRNMTFGPANFFDGIASGRLAAVGSAQPTGHGQ